MSKVLYVRISDVLHESIERLAQDSGGTIRQVAEELLRRGIGWGPNVLDDAIKRLNTYAEVGEHD